MNLYKVLVWKNPAAKCLLLGMMLVRLVQSFLPPIKKNPCYTHCGHRCQRRSSLINLFATSCPLYYWFLRRKCQFLQSYSFCFWSWINSAFDFVHLLVYWKGFRWRGREGSKSHGEVTWDNNRLHHLVNAFNLFMILTDLLTGDLFLFW